MPKFYRPLRPHRPSMVVVVQPRFPSVDEIDGVEHFDPATKSDGGRNLVCTPSEPRSGILARLWGHRGTRGRTATSRGNPAYDNHYDIRPGDRTTGAPGDRYYS